MEDKLSEDDERVKSGEEKVHHLDRGWRARLGLLFPIDDVPRQAR